MLRRLTRAARGRGHALRLLGATDGIAAVEFALVLPLMLTLYFGSVEVTQAVRAARKVDLVAGALANLASQQITCSGSTTPCLTDADMTGANGIFTAAAAIMAPFGTTDLAMTISQIKVSNQNGVLVANVDWSVTNNGGTARPCNGGGASKSLQTGDRSTGATGYQSYLPASYTSAGASTGSMIVADVTYQYKPGFNFVPFHWNEAGTLFRMGNIATYRNRNMSGGTSGPITDAMTTNKTKC